MSKELDALVAVKVMGWKLFTPPTETIATTWRKDLEHMRNEDGWYPSRSISDAWLVVEEMRKRGYQPRIEYFAHDENPIWEVEFAGETIAWVDASTAPETICRAALEALE